MGLPYPGFDAKEWVKLWFKVIAEHPEVPTNEDAMTAWFANAIMAGHDEAVWKMKGELL